MTPHDILLNETDRTVALVIAYVGTNPGAAILARFASERQSEIIRHIVEFRQDDSPEESEHQEYNPFEKIGGVDFAGELLEVLDQATWQAVLDGLSQSAPELANKTRRRILTFEKIGQLADQDIQDILRTVASSSPPSWSPWSVALQGASEELKNQIFTNMSKRSAVMLKEEIEHLGSMEPSGIEQVRRDIVDVVRSLINAGKIDWSTT